MSYDTAPSVRTTSSGLLLATRVLAGIHVLPGVGALVLAVLAFDSYGSSSPDDGLAGLAVVFGIVLVFIGVVLTVLCVSAILVRKPALAYGLALVAGLFALVVSGLGGFALANLSVVRLAFLLLSFALVGCSITGLARR